MRKRRDFSKDILICVKRLYATEDIIRSWLKSGGQMNFEDVRKCFKLGGDLTLNLPKHPLLDYNNEEKEVFTQTFGEPITFPKKFVMNISWMEFIGRIVNRRNFLRETIALTKDSQFRNYRPKKKQNETNSRSSGNRNLRDRNVGRTRNNSKRTPKKVQSDPRIRKYPR